MMKKLFRSSRGRFILCVIITNILSAVVTMFVWIPLSHSIFPVGHVLTP